MVIAPKEASEFVELADVLEDRTEASAEPVPFTIAAGSVLGTHHRQLGLNNQDAWGWEQGSWGTIAVVCDGCGSTPHSEVGAQVGVRFCLQSLRESLQRGEDPTESWFWGNLHDRLLHKLGQFARSLSGGTLEGESLDINTFSILRDYCLFTILGAVITPTVTSIFGLGDGVYALNGVVQVLKNSPENSWVHSLNNAPPYLAYGLLNPRPSCFSSKELQIRVYQQCPTAAVNALFVGTDGVMDLQAVAAQCLPGKSEPVGDLAQFWQTDRYFTNPDAVRRRLALINREVTQPDWQQRQLQKNRGLLPDDTTFICLRRGAIESYLT
jgi:hypothetical protein